MSRFQQPSAVPTPSQTVGPFFCLGMDWMNAADLVSPHDSRAVALSGGVYDGLGDPVPDAVLEVWQADAQGRFGDEAEPGWTGYGRCLTDERGRYAFQTLKPGRVPAGDGTPQAPHIDVSIFARGLLQRLVTRVYFPDEAAANEADPTLAAVGDPAARASLIAAAVDGGLQLDIHLQGERETVFFVF
jgi:protocatechuate 3,4-dioxygenase, alpha subunit